MKVINLEVDEAIYEKLAEVAKERGLRVEEELRWVIGDFVRASVPHVVPSVPLPLPDTVKSVDAAELMIRILLATGLIRCSNCGKPLTIKDLDEARCHNCSSDI
jgi:Zn finger protein HypA/HybF involved in hydrogenase expression